MRISFCTCPSKSKFQQKITKVAKTDKDVLYAADRIGYIYIYDMEIFDLEAEQKPPRG